VYLFNILFKINLYEGFLIGHLIYSFIEQKDSFKRKFLVAIASPGIKP
jgi:hypothetical protein